MRDVGPKRYASDPVENSAENHDPTGVSSWQRDGWFRAVFDSALTGMAVTTLDGRWLAVNRALWQMLGDTETELLARSLDGIAHPKGRDGSGARASQLTPGGVQPYTEEKVYLHRDGRAAWMRVTANPIRDAKGEPEGIFHQFVDITELKRIEAEYKQVLELESAARLAAEREATRSGFLAAAGRAMAASLEIDKIIGSLTEWLVPQLADLCVLDVIEPAGETCRTISGGLDPQQRELALELAKFPLDPLGDALPAEVFRSGESRLLSCDEAAFESLASNPEHLRILREIRPRFAMVVPLSTGRRVLGTLVLFVTRSDRTLDRDDLSLAEAVATCAALTMESAVMYRAACAATTARDRILAIVAHDLRTPLGAISLAAESLQNGQSSAETAELIVGVTDRMNRLIQNLIDLPSIETGTLILEPFAQEVDPLLDDLRETMLPFARSRSVHLRFHVEDELPPVFVDRDRIWQVLLNILDNALRFSPEGTDVIIRAERAGDGVCFSISDAGPGMPQEHLAEMFLPFWGVSKQVGRRGIGLGLAIAKTIVLAHGGRIWADSSPGVGMTLHLVLPYAAE